MLAGSGALITAAHADGCSFTLHPGPVFTTGPKDAWDAGEVDPGAVVFHGGKFHMLYNGLKANPTAYSIGYATSTDGVNWQRVSADPVMKLGDADPTLLKNLIANSVVVLKDGTWVLYFTVSRSKISYAGRIGRATAPSPRGPWKVDAEPVLLPGEAGEWDAKAVGHASVVRVEDSYRMYYSGFGKIQLATYRGERMMIGMAQSSDGVHWTKYNDPSNDDDPSYTSSDPVFRAVPTKGIWDNWHIFDADVQKTNDGWKMTYRSSKETSFGDIGCATSDDGIRWTRSPANPIVINKSVKEAQIFFTTYIHHDGRDFVMFEAGWEDDMRIYLLSKP